MILSVTEDNKPGEMSVSEPALDHAEDAPISSPASKQTVEEPDDDRAKTDAKTSSTITSGNVSKKATSKTKEHHDTVQKVKVMHEILDRKLKKAEEQKTFLFQERANKRRTFNHLRRTLSNNNKSELGDETTLEQMRLQLEALREEKDHVEEEIVKTTQRLEELVIIKTSPEEKAARLDELCTQVTKEFASRRKPAYEA
ncbi:hypothetical protein MPSEU_000304200 [Mayamaea pseudoterrestris]|nr:hypothetical protein MPSEU_000304200 [Mayamaea pseudoterrestris]